ncbi:MAG: TonB-dependent receptor [Muribaculaceae bacterium]|jgi:Outer membrane receptor proteins, mostly Fe transport|nr:TonB-dependent receptor [Muribaculaceae bacterium]
MTITRIQHVTAALLFSVVTMNSANGAEIHPTDSIGFDTARLAVSLKEVEFTANGRATSTTPVAFTNLTAKKISEVNDGRDLPYLMQMTPGVITTSDAGNGIGYTSMRVRGSDGSRINVTANGIPVNDPESHNVYWVNMPDLASSVRDVQIQRGVGLSTNGAGAFGASVNMATSVPSSDPYTAIDASYGSYNSYKATLRLGTGLLHDQWSADFRLSKLGSDGYIERAKSNLWSYFGQIAYENVGTRLRFLSFGGKQKTYMAWDYASADEMAEYGRRYNPCGKYTDSEGNTAYYQNQNDNYTQYHFHLLLGQRLGDKWYMNAGLHYTKGDGYYEQYKTSRTLIEYGLQPFEDSEGNIVKKQDLVRLKNMNNGFGGGVMSFNYNSNLIQAVIGGAVNHFKGHHFGQVAWVRNYIGTIDPLQEYYRNTGDKTDANIYARANVHIFSGLSGLADMQYRHIGYSINGVSDTYDYSIGGMQQLDIDRHYNFFNPKIGLNYATADGRNRVFASWSVAHKEPTRDNFIDCDPDKTPRPERLMDYELGWQLYLSNLTLGANLYFMDYKDQLVATGQLSDTGNAISVNVPSSYRTGIELQAGLKPARWFDWELSVSLSRNRIKNFTEYIYEDEWTNPIAFDLGSTPIAFSPDATAANAFNFHLLNSIDATLATRYIGKQYLTNTGSNEQSLKAYCVSDLRLSYTTNTIPSVKELKIGFTIYNLFNAIYENNGYAGAGYYVDSEGSKVIYRYSGYAAQAPTNIMASIALKF